MRKVVVEVFLFCDKQANRRKTRLFFFDFYFPESPKRTQTGSQRDEGNNMEIPTKILPFLRTWRLNFSKSLQLFFLWKFCNWIHLIPTISKLCLNHSSCEMNFYKKNCDRSESRFATECNNIQTIRPRHNWRSSKRSFLNCRKHFYLVALLRRDFS